jgi:trigger factor
MNQSAPLNVRVAEAGPVTRTMHVEVPAARVAAARGAVVREIQSRARIPGFRPGKAPVQVVEKSYREDIESATLDRVLRESIGEALEKVAEPVLHVQSVRPQALQAGAALAYEATIEVQPKFELRKYKGIKIDRPTREVSDADVDRVLESLRVREAEFSAAMSGECLAVGDRVTLSYTATRDGNPVPDGRADHYTAQIGSGGLHPQFESGILGAAAGEQRSFAVTFGEDDAPSEALRHATVDFSVQIESLEKRRLPELDDAFASRMMADATLASLRDRIRADLARSVAEEAQQAMEAQAIEALLADQDFPVPPGLVDRRRRALAEDIAQRLLHQGYAKQTVQQLAPRLLSDAGDRAERDVRLSFVLTAIADAESIVVTDEDLNEEVRRIAAALGEPFETALARVKRQGLTESIRGELRNRKALATVIAAAQVKDITPEAFAEKRRKRQEDRDANRK